MEGARDWEGGASDKVGRARDWEVRLGLDYMVRGSDRVGGSETGWEGLRLAEGGGV